MAIKKIAEPVINEASNTNKKNPMSTSFLESASYWFGIAAVTFTAAAAVAGSFSWYFSNRLSNKKSAEFEAFRESSKAAIVEAQARSAEANARAAEANKIAEDEKLARVKLEARLAPRSLKGKSQDSVVKAIEPFAPQPFDLLWYSDDPESHILASDVNNALQRAKWVLDRPVDSWLGFGVVLGVVIEFNPSEKDTVAAACEALVSALRKEGIAATAQPSTGEDKEHQPKTLKIRVGKKP